MRTFRYGVDINLQKEDARNILVKIDCIKNSIHSSSFSKVYECKVNEQIKISFIISFKSDSLISILPTLAITDGLSTINHLLKEKYIEKETDLYTILTTNYQIEDNNYIFFINFLFDDKNNYKEKYSYFIKNDEKFFENNQIIKTVYFMNLISKTNFNDDKELLYLLLSYYSLLEHDYMHLSCEQNVYDLLLDKLSFYGKEKYISGSYCEKSMDSVMEILYSKIDNSNSTSSDYIPLCEIERACFTYLD